MECWELFLKNQESELGTEIVDKWLRTLKILHYDACNLYLEAHDTFHLTWFEEHIRPKLRSNLFNNNHRKVQVHVTIKNNSGPPKGYEKSKIHAKEKAYFKEDSLDPHFLFENFIYSEKNQLTYSFFTEFIEEIKKKENTIKKATFNPIFLYGNSGSGKTHILMSLAHLFKKCSIRCFYIRAESFTEHVISAIRSGTMEEFRKTYRHTEVLLVDDVHQFAKKTATQEEFFHTFNSLQTAGRQVILSANRAPHFLEEIEPRLISRFEWGILLPLEKLSGKHLRNFLIHRSKLFDFPLSCEVIDFLLHHFSRNLKVLQTAFDALVLRYTLEQNKSPSQLSLPLSLSEAAFFLSSLLEEEKKHILTPQKIIQIVSEFYGIYSSDILGKAQHHEFSLPRQVAIFLCRQKLQISLLKLGSIFSRDHSTILSSIKQIEKKISSGDQEFEKNLQTLTYRIEKLQEI